MKVSVVIPVYNVEKYIEDCLRSVINQTYTDLEIICIDDAGNDGSKDIVKKFMASDSRIKLVENEANMGLAAVRNRGLEIAEGRYVYFLDSDDMIKENAIEELCSLSEAENLDACIFAAEFIYDDVNIDEMQKKDRSRYKGSYPFVLTGKELFKAWMEAWDWMPSQPRYFYRRDFLEKNNIRFIDGILHEDETFAFDVLMNADRVRVLDEAYFIRRFRASSIMNTVPTMRNVEGCVEILCHVDDYLAGYGMRLFDGSGFYNDDAELIEGIRYYGSKIFRDVIRKYREVLYHHLPDEPTERIKSSKIKTAMLERIRKFSRLEVFDCSSHYQILVALMKAMTEGYSIDLILEEHGIKNASDLAPRLASMLPQYVAGVFFCREHEEVDPYEEKNAAADPQLASLVKECVEWDLGDKVEARLRKYDRINVFWDLGFLGTYLNIKGINYTLHEDSLNSYKHIKANRPNYAFIFNEEERNTHEGVVPFGYSPYCEAVEVNDISGIEIPADKVKVRSREQMINSLTDYQKKLIFDVFVDTDLNVKHLNELTCGTVLILTEPFAITGRLKDEEVQISLYEDLIAKYGKGKRVVIKAHPRDILNYGKLFPGVDVIPRLVPMEVLNFDKDFHIDTAVTVTSSAIYGLQNAEEKIYLGAEYLESYR